MIVGYQAQVGTVEYGSSLRVASLGEAFDEVLALYPTVEKLRLEEWGPGDDMVPILDTVELANKPKRYLSRYIGCWDCPAASIQPARLTVNHRSRGTMHVCQACFDRLVERDELLPLED